VLAPNLRPAQVVITDNLSAHKTERVRELVEQRGCELLYLPPYSPDLNPIEEAFSKIKGLLRKAEARNRETLVEVMGQVLSSTGSITMISAVRRVICNEARLIGPPNDAAVGRGSR
jgi:transposase